MAAAHELRRTWAASRSGLSNSPEEGRPASGSARS